MKNKCEENNYFRIMIERFLVLKSGPAENQVLVKPSLIILVLL